MKKIKTLAFTGLLTLGVFSMVAYTSCSKNKDKCKEVVCSNGGACVDGACECALGYEGANCETNSVAKFTGVYNALDNCPLGSRTGDDLEYVLTISPLNTDATKVKVSGVAATDNIVTAVVSADGKELTIDDQVLTDGKVLSANIKYITNGALTMSFKISQNGVPFEACNTNLTKN